MKIGRLKKVDLRGIWAGEATDFTPWLAKEDNIALLSETVGIELEVISEEKSVGPFRADILCKSTIDDTYVLIENQLEKTDHNHLGQLMTYAAGLEAVTIIWISSKFTDEHRAALDWLNRVTDEKLRFFGIEIEAYQIGESIPAPLFQMVSKPNDWTKAIHSEQKHTDLTPTKELNLEYWSEMRKYFEDSGTRLKTQKPSPQHWTNFAIGRSDFHMAVVASVRDNFIRVELNLVGPVAKDRFFELKEKFETLSFEKVANDLVWDELEGRTMSWMYLKKDADISNKDDWYNQFAWIQEKLEKMDAFFRPKIKQIK
ncbi:DUF4268 domain-containing protein [Lentimicrobium sp. S6]|uniref:DUF4268 domain-containing protein n=1 Tax=Lentimicrobium sp. S6 TaxID=2735872 RepID=UPI0015542B0A|nr:DUF4268 domain-containing protein [Lentimicrobium sp. S6]NPD47611.1 DUF4268 domain-containing protein [Lentimicrobium sp. S6]